MHLSFWLSLYYLGAKRYLSAVFLKHCSVAWTKQEKDIGSLNQWFYLGIPLTSIQILNSKENHWITILFYKCIDPWEGFLEDWQKEGQINSWFANNWPTHLWEMQPFRYKPSSGDGLFAKVISFHLCQWMPEKSKRQSTNECFKLTDTDKITSKHKRLIKRWIDSPKETDQD